MVNSVLDALARALPAHQIAGRYAVDVLGLLLPLPAQSNGEGVRLWGSGDLKNPGEIESLFKEEAPDSISRAALRNGVLVLHPRGEFLATDRLLVARFVTHDDAWSIVLNIVHTENMNIIPAPRELYVVLELDVGDRKPECLSLEFISRWHDFQGKQIRPDEPAAHSQVIRFTD